MRVSSDRRGMIAPLNETMAAQQEGLLNSSLCQTYYDVMLVGMTGQGKSTTADKLLIANPSGEKYEPFDFEPSADGDKVILEDISMWLLKQEDNNEHLGKRLKDLISCRTHPHPHDKVNTMRDPRNTLSTESCEVLSNDTTKIRILDVPGFFDKGVVSPIRPESFSADFRASYSDVANSNLSIVRNIIRIQSSLGMHFRRIVYFLPCRGPLERASAILKLELQLLEHVFGKSIFECMVAVATISRRHSLKKESDDEKFPEEDIAQCDEIFKAAIKDILPSLPEPKVPIIFISLAESCESILKKIQDAEVECKEGLRLQFNPNTCSQCGMKIGSIRGEKVVCSFEENPSLSSSIPYNESTCHPAFKYSLLRLLLGRTISKVISHKWPSYKEEYCIACNERPFTPGCMQVKREYQSSRRGKKYIVDHTSQVNEPEIDEGGRAEPLA